MHDSVVGQAHLLRKSLELPVILSTLHFDRNSVPYHQQIKQEAL